MRRPPGRRASGGKGALPAPPANPPKFLVLGDSISVGVPFIDNVQCVSLGQPGNTVSDQQFKFDASIYSWQVGLLAVIIEVGINDIYVLAHNDVQLAASYQGLIADVKAKNPNVNCKIVAQCLSPARGVLTVPGYTAWQEFNKDVLGTGTHNLTNVDAVVSSHVAALGDGNDFLAAAYDSGDHLHPNAAGKQIISDAWVAALTSLGLLP